MPTSTCASLAPCRCMALCSECDRAHILCHGCVADGKLWSLVRSQVPSDTMEINGYMDTKNQYITQRKKWSTRRSSRPSPRLHQLARVALGHHVVVRIQLPPVGWAIRHLVQLRPRLLRKRRPNPSQHLHHQAYTEGIPQCVPSHMRERMGFFRWMMLTATFLVILRSCGGSSLQSLR